MTEKTTIPNLSYKDFKNLCLRKVQHDNCLDLVDTWQDNILHLDFTKSENEDYYAATIYFIQECTKSGYFIKKYEYSYLAEYGKLYAEDYELITREVLQNIAKFENLVSKSKDKFIFGALKEFHNKSKMEVVK